MIRKAKGLELMKIVFITHFSAFGSKMFFWPWIMDFENVALTKIVHIYVIKAWMHNIYNIKSFCSQNVFIFTMYC